MSDWTLEELANVITEIQAKAKEDDKFRQLCLDDLRLVIKQFSGKSVPSDFVLETRDNDEEYSEPLALFKPESISLSDEDLDHVVGGGLIGGVMFGGLVGISMGSTIASGISAGVSMSGPVAGVAVCGTGAAVCGVAGVGCCAGILLPLQK
jgi:hypothetical protein